MNLDPVFLPTILLTQIPHLTLEGSQWLFLLTVLVVDRVWLWSQTQADLGSNCVNFGR